MTKEKHVTLLDPSDLRGISVPTSKEDAEKYLGAIFK